MQFSNIFHKLLVLNKFCINSSRKVTGCPIREMQALQFTASDKSLEISKIYAPTIRTPNEVLIQVAYAGICGTDIHILDGDFPCTKDKPITLGHEFCGKIVGVGDHVTTIKLHDRVAVNPSSSCNCCEFCLTAKPHLCPTGGLNSYVGMFCNGGWAEYCVAPVSQVHKLPKELSLENGVLSEPMSCLVHNYDVIGPLPIGSKILIMGCGIIGTLVAASLHYQGHRKVTVSEPKRSRLELIANLKTCFHLTTPHDLKRMQKDDPNYLFDVIIDCSGNPSAIEHAVTLLEKGGKLACFGVAPPQGTISISPFDMFMKEINICGVVINPFSFHRAIALLTAMSKSYISYEKLGIKTFKLENFKQAITELREGCIAKAVFTFSF